MFSCVQHMPPISSIFFYYHNSTLWKSQIRVSLFMWFSQFSCYILSQILTPCLALCLLTPSHDALPSGWSLLKYTHKEINVRNCYYEIWFLAQTEEAFKNYDGLHATPRPILWPRGLRHRATALFRIPLRAQMFILAFVCSVLLCGYRPCDELIIRSRSPTVCQKLIRKPNNGGQCPRGLYNRWWMNIQSLPLPRQSGRH